MKRAIFALAVACTTTTLLSLAHGDSCDSVSDNEKQDCGYVGIDESGTTCHITAKTTTATAEALAPASVPSGPFTARHSISLCVLI